MNTNSSLSKKLDKEANRFIQQWPEEKIAIENGRWGPFIRFGKDMLKLRSDKGERFTPEDLKTLALDEVKKMILDQVPNAFDKKGKKGAAKSTEAKIKKLPAKKAAKKTTVKKAASKKAAPRKAAAKKATKK